MSKGYDDLWQWFWLSRASFCVMPRVLMHEMPDEWQEKMAALLSEWDEAWDTHHLPSAQITAVESDGKFTKWPRWVLNYRHPDREAIESVRRAKA